MPKMNEEISEMIPGKWSVPKTHHLHHLTMHIMLPEATEKI
jgi:hypothetical protein